MSVKTVKEKYVEELTSELDLLREMKLGTDEYKATVDGVVKLTDRLAELEKIENDALARDDELTIKRKQLRNENFDVVCKHVLGVLGIAVPAGLGVWAFLKSMVFEETGTMTTTGGKRSLDFLLRIFKK